MNTNEDLALAIESTQKAIDLAEAVLRLQDNKDFQEVFREKYVKDYALTQIQNVCVYDQVALKGFVEESMARSHFVRFIDGLVDDGKQAVEAMHDLKSMKE